MLLTAITVMCALIFLYQFVLTHQLIDIRTLILEQRNNEVAEPFEYVEEEPTENEVERQKNEQAFNERIARIKEELANQQANMNRTGVSADELHPNVKNLPHDHISDYSKTSDVEYAE